MTLEEALSERMRALARTKERLSALDDPTAEHVVQEVDRDSVLRQAKDVLDSRLDAAQRLLRGEEVAGCDDMGRAGLVVWDPVSNASRPTPLLIELMKVRDR